MPYATMGDRIRVHLTAQLKSGERVYSTHGGQPFLLTLGEGKVITGLEDAIEGMAPGEKKTVTVPGDTANEVTEATEIVRIDTGPGGREAIMQVGEPQPPAEYPMILTETPESLLVDEKSPLAGEDLIFDIELLEILS